MQHPELYLKKLEDETWLDAHEKELLADKTFFTSRPIIAKVFLARLKKMDLRREAFLVLDEENSCMEIEEVTLAWMNHDFSVSSLKEAFAGYNRFKMQWQLLVFQSFSVKALNEVVLYGIEQHENWLKSLSFSVPIHDQDTLLSKAPDPAVLQEAINSFDALGGKTVADALEMEYLQKETLIGELKRLSLQLEKEK